MPGRLELEVGNFHYYIHINKDQQQYVGLAIAALLDGENAMY